MKRSLAVILMSVCLFAGSAFALTVEEEIDLLKKDVEKIKSSDKGGSLSEALGITVEGGGTFVLQGVDKANDGSDKAVNNASYSIDLGFGKEFDNGGKAFIHLEAGNGDGLGSGIVTFANVNRDAGNSGNVVEVTEFWYEQPLFGEKLSVTFGKIDPTGYLDQNEFANDETSQFINSAFRNNAAVAFEDNNMGFTMTYSPADIIDITYAYMATNGSMDKIDCDGFNALQVNFKPFEKGNYRLMYWSSNRELEKFKNGEKTGGYGLAVSIDQAISETVGLFGRFSWRDPEVYETAAAWSFGTQFGGSMWSRENDALGLAVGQIMSSQDWVDSAAGRKDDAETQTELYYSFSVSDNLVLTPALQYIMKPIGGNAADDKDLFVYGIRAQVNF